MAEVAAADGDQRLAMQYRVEAADKLRFLGDTRAIRELRMRHYASALDFLLIANADSASNELTVFEHRIRQTMEDIAHRGNRTYGGMVAKWRRLR